MLVRRKSTCLQLTGSGSPQDLYSWPWFIGHTGDYACPLLLHCRLRVGGEQVPQEKEHWVTVLNQIQRKTQRLFKVGFGKRPRTLLGECDSRMFQNGTGKRIGIRNGTFYSGDWRGSICSKGNTARREGLGITTRLQGKNRTQHQSFPAFNKYSPRVILKNCNRARIRAIIKPATGAGGFFSKAILAACISILAVISRN